MTSGVLGAVTPIGAADASDAPSSKRSRSVCAGERRGQGWARHDIAQRDEVSGSRRASERLALATARIRDCRRRRAFMIPRATRIPAVSALLPTSRAGGHKLIEDALAILCNLEHRGAVGADPRAGDGAGI